MTAPAIQITMAEVEEMVGRAPVFERASSREAAPIAAALEKHVREFLEGAPWKPFHHTLGISGYEVYFNHPAEMFYALSIATPVLPASTAARVKQFLAAQARQPPPYGLDGFYNRTGRARESYDVPEELRIAGRGRAGSAFGVYAFWAYCHYVAPDALSAEHWSAIRTRMQPLLTNDYVFDPARKDYRKDEAEKLNGDIAGLVGLVRLARLRNDRAAEKPAIERLRSLLELRVNLERINPRILEATESSTKHLHTSKLARFCHLLPELGQALREHTAGCAAARLKRFRVARNGWHLAFAERMIGGENYTNPLHFSKALFDGAVFVEALPTEELLSFVDVPWCKGDFYFIEKCVYSLASALTDEMRPLLRDFIGINGHTVQFKPELYRPVCGLVRDYHPVEWDLGTNTTVLPEFPFAKNRVDWSQVYGSWRAKAWDIDACLMFESVKQSDWKDLEADARAYGKAFAQQFGPSGQRKLVDSVEIGNEPGKWSDADYTRIFKAMAEGIRAGDRKLKIATCNLTTGKSGDYEKSVACVGKLPELFDVLNIHTYAQLESWPTWRRSYPEDPKLPKYLQDVEALCRWRDAHAPGKPVWITEFGYDSSTKPAEKAGTFAKWQGVTDEQQAQWLVRSLLVFSAMPVERAYIYFFNDDDQPSLHASAGITRHFQPKPSYHALAHLQRVLGEYRFQSIVTNEPGRLRVQEYANNSKKRVWVVWSPTGDGSTRTVTLDKVPGKLVDVQRMPLTSSPSNRPSVTQGENGRITLQATESPAYLVFEKP